MPPFQRLHLPRSILDELIVHALGDLPNECCGLLAGRLVAGIGIATARYPIGNDEASPQEYSSNPRDMLDAFRSMRESSLELLAIYHSHPSTGPVPSQRDLERNNYGESVVHLIVSLAASPSKVRGWWLNETGSREAEWSIESL